MALIALCVVAASRETMQSAERYGFSMVDPTGVFRSRSRRTGSSLAPARKWSGARNEYLRLAERSDVTRRGRAYFFAAASRLCGRSS
jgi:hypothetical protein